MVYFFIRVSDNDEKIINIEHNYLASDEDILLSLLQMENNDDTKMVPKSVRFFM